MTDPNFQAIASDGDGTVRDWKTHINGASQLLKLRGERQLQSPLVRLIFREVAAQIVRRATSLRSEIELC